MSKRPPVRTKKNFLIFGSTAIEQAEIDEVVACLISRGIGSGPRTAAFERDFAAYKGVNTAMALRSCTAALHLAMVSLNLKPDDEVITTQLSFCATVNAILHGGGAPVLTDIDPVTLNTAAAGAALRPRLLPEIHTQRAMGATTAGASAAGM